MFCSQRVERLARYPDRSLAEDAGLLDQAVRRGARLEAIDAAGLYVYIRHAGNSWQLVHGRTVDPGGLAAGLRSPRYPRTTAPLTAPWARRPR